MKLQEGFITHTSDGNQIMVAVGEAANRFHGLVRSNRTAAFIIECLEKECTEKQIVDAVIEKYDITLDVVEKDVAMIIEALRQIGAIHE